MMNEQTRTNRFTFMFIGIALLAVCSSEAKILNEHITTPDHDYTIHYYNRDSTDTNWFTDDGDAQSIADHFDPDTGTGIHDAQANLSFREPAGYRRDVKLVEEWDPGVGGSANWTRIRLPVALLDEIGHGGTVALGVCVHEAHHICQYEYIGANSSYASSTFGMLGFEGPATAMMDMLFSSTDSWRTSDLKWTALGWMDGYLDTGASGSNHDDYLWGNNGYESALFWKYLTEQFGSTRTEPEVGADVIRRFYELADENRLGISTTIQDVLDEKNRWSTIAWDKGVDLKEVFQDFTIANWLRRYRSPRAWGSGYTFALADPARFYYVDENPATSSTALCQFYTLGTNTYSVSASSNERPLAADVHSLTAGNNTGTQTINLEKWAARYVQCNYTGSPTGSHGIGFWAQTESGGRMWYSLFGIRQSQTIDLLEKGTVDPSTGNSFKYATMQSASDPYTMLVAVFNGETGPSLDGLTRLTVDADYNFGYFEPTLDIVEPTQNYRAYVGDGADPERFLVRLRVSSPDYLGLGSLTGLEADQFDVFVGNSDAAANQGEVIAAAYVLGEYWLTVQAPVKAPSPAAAVGLIVRLGDTSDVEEAAVVYDYLEVDQVLVIDRSGSMGRTSGGVKRIDGARAAAQLFVDTSGSDDQIGIVRFNGDDDESTETGTNSYADAQVLYSLQQMDSQFERDLVNLWIDEGNPTGDKLEPEGWTSIGDGLFWGAKELVDNGKAESEKWIILLSDGHQNEPSTFDEQFNLLFATGVRVETIALGPNADKNHLQSIANETNGKFYEVQAMEASSKNGTTGGSMILDLANTYLLSSERIHRRDRILENAGSIGGNAAIVCELELNEGGLSDCIATVYANDSNADLDFFIMSPAGATFPLPDAGTNSWDPSFYTTYRTNTMEDGLWTLTITNNSANAESYLMVLSGKNKQGVQSFLHFAQYHGDSTAYSENGLYLRGLPMPISMVLTDGQGPVIGADVIAEVSHPARLLTTLRLRDNGNGHDGAANDGVYSGVFAATTEADSSGGTYSETNPPTIGASFHVRVNSSGKDNLQRDFQRVDNGSFHLYEMEQGLGGDIDGDGMPNRYEILHVGLDKTTQDDFRDLDGDGLTNGDEYQAGTDPRAADTDGGGENDKSEIDNGGNPLDHSDDVFSPPLQARVLGLHPLDHSRPVDPTSPFYPKPFQNILGFAVERGYEGMEIYSSLVSSNSFTLLDTVPVGDEGGIYTHSNLVNFTTYYYYIVPLGAGGRRGVPSHIFSGTPRHDYSAPEGVLSINNNLPVTISPSVKLSIFSIQDATTMKVGNSSNLKPMTWQPFSPTVTSHPLGSPVNGKASTVYVLLRDAAGNENLISDSITFLSPTNAASFIGRAMAPCDTSNRGIGVTFLATNGITYNAKTPTNGLFNVPLPPNTYDVEIELRGYETVTFSNQTLVAGAQIDLGLINLVPLDSDGDSLKDVFELRDYMTDRNLADTDGDGINDGDEVQVFMTDPTNAASVLRIETLPGLSASNGMFCFAFQSVPGLTYMVQGSSNLVDWVPALTSGVPVSVSSTAEVSWVWIDLPEGNASKHFIRLAIP